MFTSLDVIFIIQEVLQDFPVEVGQGEPKKRVKRQMTTAGNKLMTCLYIGFYWHYIDTSATSII